MQPKTGLPIGSLVLLAAVSISLAGCNLPSPGSSDHATGTPEESASGDPVRKDRPSWLAQLFGDAGQPEITATDAMPEPALEATPIEQAAPIVPPTATPLPAPTLAPTTLPTETPTPLPSPTVPEVSPTTPATVISFSADAQGRVPPGSPVTLAWEIEGGGWVAICAYDHNGWELECQHDLPHSGSTIFIMPEVFWVEYELQAGGLVVDLWPRILVHATCTNQWFFSDPTPPFACPNAPLGTFMPAVAQRFEHGWMIRPIIWGGTFLDIFFDDSTYRGVWWEAEQESPVDLSGITPPEGLYLPDPVLAAAWLGQFDGTADLRDRLGWATAPAFPFQTLVQCEVNPPGPITQPCYQPAPAGYIYQYASSVVRSDHGASGVKEGTWQVYQPDN